MSTDRIKVAVLSGYFCLVCTVLGSLIVFRLLKPLLNTEPRRATVLSSKITPIADNGDDEWLPIVEYQYTYDGQTFTNKRLTPRVIEPGYDWKFRASSVVEQYPEGKEITVYVWPESPSEAFLYYGWPEFSTWMFTLGLFLFAALTGYAFVTVIRGEGVVG